jgi:hypothetical protein
MSLKGSTTDWTVKRRNRQQQCSLPEHQGFAMTCHDLCYTNDSSRVSCSPSPTLGPICAVCARLIDSSGHPTSPNSSDPCMQAGDPGPHRHKHHRPYFERVSASLEHSSFCCGGWGLHTDRAPLDLWRPSTYFNSIERSQSVSVMMLIVPPPYGGPRLVDLSSAA